MAAPCYQMRPRLGSSPCPAHQCHAWWLEGRTKHLWALLVRHVWGTQGDEQCLWSKVTPESFWKDHVPLTSRKMDKLSQVCICTEFPRRLIQLAFLQQNYFSHPWPRTKYLCVCGVFPHHRRNVQHLQDGIGSSVIYDDQEIVKRHVDYTSGLDSKTYSGHHKCTQGKEKKS